MSAAAAEDDAAPGLESPDVVTKVLLRSSSTGVLSENHIPHTWETM